jgi:transposase
VDTIPVAARADLTDEQWAVLEPLLPAGSGLGRPPVWSRRQLIDGIRWRVRAGTPWRDVPFWYGSWQSVYGLFRRWQRDGTWAAIVTALQARADAARADHVGCQRRFDNGAGASACRRSQFARPGTEGAAGWAGHRTGRPRLGPLARRVHHQGESSRRTRPEAAVDRDHRRTAWRQPAVRGGAGRYPGASAGRRCAPHPPGSRAG